MTADGELKISRPYSVEFFDLQLRFAAKVAKICCVPFAEVIGQYTNLYVRLAMGPRLEPANSDWQGYLAGLINAPEPAAWTHSLHRRRLHLPVGTPALEVVGCFSYAPAGKGSVRIHFNVDGECLDSPLSRANFYQRRNELATLLSRLKNSFEDDAQIIGSSWLYNLASYRRLFPERYLASLHAIEHPYQRMPLWGQFLDRHRNVRAGLGPAFVSNVENASSREELAACFPCHVLATTAPAKWLYEHFGL